MIDLFINMKVGVKKIRILFCILLITLCSSLHAITINVTSVADSGPNTLRTAITSAIPLANAGNTVDILFNAPAGLCHISTFLPSINITAGAINFRKDLAATTSQGIEFSGASGDFSYLTGLLIN